MEYIKEHLYITEQNGIYFLNSDIGYKFYDNTVEEYERIYWSKRSLGFDKSVTTNFDVIDEATADEMSTRMQEYYASQTHGGMTI